jgi:RecB family exonuclease/superfamily I DNA/RNA helicase
MERRGTDNPLSERILSSGAPVVVIRGPAGCGKTTAALDVYRHYLDAATGRPGCLLLGPNSSAVRELRRLITDGSPGGVAVGPAAMTFAGLAGRVLLAAGTKARPASPFERRILLAGIVDELCAAGQLAALAVVADTPGLVVALDRAIAEIKRAAIEPDEFASAVGKASDRRGDLVAVYRRYQDELNARGLYDVEGQAWLAREQLRQAISNSTGAVRPGRDGRDTHGQVLGTPNGDARVTHGRDAHATPAGLPGLDGIRAVVADGFTDFTPTQLEILAAMAGRIERVAITLPHAQDNRRRMWHWTDRTLNNIRRQFGDRLAEIVADRDAGHVPCPASHANDKGQSETDTPSSNPQSTIPWGQVPNPQSAIRNPQSGCGQLPLCGLGAQNSFGPLWDSVFDIDASCELPDGLSVIAAAGMDGEVAAVARRIKRLLVGGAPAGRIAVLARGLDAYDATIRRVFAEHDIPLAPAPEALTEVPIIRFAMDVASLGAELAWHDVLRVIRSSYFRAPALGDFDERTVAAAETLIRDGNVQAGRKAYADAAERLADRADRDRASAAETDEPDADDPRRPRAPSERPTADEFRQAGAMLARLFDLSARGAEPAGLGEVVTTLQLAGVACELGEPELIARDLRALATLEDHLARLGEPPPPAVNVRSALAAVACPAARGESLVDVMGVLDARAIRYDHVFVLGVSERMFPRQHSESSLVGEADRAAWRRRGVVLDNRSDLTAREMLLFYLAITRADRTLTLSYLEADASGAAGSASSFLLALGAAVGGLDRLPAERIAPGPHIPAAENIASRRDALCAGLAGLLGSELPPAPLALAWSAKAGAEALRRAAMGVWAAHQRWKPGQCNQFDGRITDPALLEDLHGRYTNSPTFSAGRLNAFGQCPWQYFATYILRLAPQVEPERRLEPAARGTFCHDVLFRLMRSLAGKAGSPVRLADVPPDKLEAELDAAIDAEARSVESRRPPYPVLWHIQLGQMRRDLRSYLQAAADPNALATRAMRFELSFGTELDPDQPHDDASTPEPVAVATPAGEIRLCGRLDRVDSVAFGEVAGLLIVDYKTGRLPVEKDVLEGRNLQLPLYAAAAEAMLGQKCVGGAFHKIGSGAGRFERFFAAVTTARGSEPYKVDDAYQAKLDAAMATVGQFVQRMAQGRFDALPTHDCPGYCPLRQICQYSSVRAERKTPPAEAEDDAGNDDAARGDSAAGEKEDR